jgi:hypothetical protein
VEEEHSLLGLQCTSDAQEYPTILESALFIIFQLTFKFTQKDGVSSLLAEPATDATFTPKVKPGSLNIQNTGLYLLTAFSVCVII